MELRVPRVRKLPVAADPTTDPIPVFVRAARKTAGMSGAEFGRVFDFTKGTVSHWKKGINTPDYAVLVKISAMSGVPLPAMLPAADSGFGAGAMKQLDEFASLRHDDPLEWRHEGMTVGVTLLE